MVVDDNDNVILLINKGDDSTTIKSDPFYGIGIFSRSNVYESSDDLIADNGEIYLADTKMFDCPGAPNHYHCRAHAIAYNSNNQIMIGGVHTSGGHIKIVMHLFVA